jgi:Uma2 family endonuclease
MRNSLNLGWYAMSTTSTIPTTPPGVAPMVYRISVDEYERMVAAGVSDDPRVELINGLLVRNMGKNPPHVIATKWLGRLLDRIVPPGWHVSKEDPVRIPALDEPEPDLAIISGAPEDYRTRHPGPGDIALLVEVSEKGLDSDQGDKLSAYAAGGVPVYWIVNLVNHWVEVYSNPRPKGYQSRQDFTSGQDIAVVIGGVERGRIAVSDILP